MAEQVVCPHGRQRSTICGFIRRHHRIVGDIPEDVIGVVYAFYFVSTPSLLLRWRSNLQFQRNCVCYLKHAFPGVFGVRNAGGFTECVNGIRFLANELKTGRDGVSSKGVGRCSLLRFVANKEKMMQLIGLSGARCRWITEQIDFMGAFEELQEVMEQR